MSGELCYRVLNAVTKTDHYDVPNIIIYQFLIFYSNLSFNTEFLLFQSTYIENKYSDFSVLSQLLNTKKRREIRVLLLKTLRKVEMNFSPSLLSRRNRVDEYCLVFNKNVEQRSVKFTFIRRSIILHHDNELLFSFNSLCVQAFFLVSPFPSSNYSSDLTFSLYFFEELGSHSFCFPRLTRSFRFIYFSMLMRKS